MATTQPEITMATYLVVCHTENCENNDIAIVIQAPSPNPYIVCGACGQQITDITEIPAE